MVPHRLIGKPFIKLGVVRFKAVQKLIMGGANALSRLKLTYTLHLNLSDVNKCQIKMHFLKRPFCLLLQVFILTHS